MVIFFKLGLWVLIDIVPVCFRVPKELNESTEVLITQVAIKADDNISIFKFKGFFLNVPVEAALNISLIALKEALHFNMVIFSEHDDSLRCVSLI